MPLSREQFMSLQWGDSFSGSSRLRNIKVVAVTVDEGDACKVVAVRRWHDEDPTWLKWDNKTDSLKSTTSAEPDILEAFLYDDVRIVPEDVDLALDRLEKEGAIHPDILERLRRASRVSVQNGMGIMDISL